MSVFVDSHAHLTSREFDADRDDVIRRAADAGVTAIVNPATNLDDSRKAVALAEAHSGVLACVGFHPHDARLADETSLREIEELSRHPKVVAIGEIGLDFHYDFAPPDRQEEVFRFHLDLACERHRPVVIHARAAEERVCDILGEYCSRMREAFGAGALQGPSGGLPHHLWNPR